MGEDPTCFFEPEDETTVSEHEAETNRMFKRYAFMVRQARNSRTEKPEPAARTDEETRR